MALEQIGLGGILSFEVNRAVKDMDRARDSLGRFVQGAQKVQPALNSMNMGFSSLGNQLAAFGSGMARGVGSIASGVAGLGLAFAPFGIAVGIGISQAVAFEKAMQRVDAVTLSTPENLKKLSNFAEIAGLNLGYTAIETAAGMEVMARAGAETKDIMAGLPAVMAGAAAEGISVEKAMDIASVAMHTMGLNWKDMGTIENVLARTSANTASSMSSLGEAFAYGGQAARTAGLSLEQTAAIFGTFHDAGLKGSTAGTAFDNVMQKMAKPTKDGTELLAKWGIRMTHEKNGAIAFSDIISQVSEHLDKYKTNLEKIAAVNTIFGVRGGRGVLAEIASQKKSKIVQQYNIEHPDAKLEDNSTNALTMSNKTASAGNGAAFEMAQRQLDSVAGSWSMLKASFNTANIEIFQNLLKPLATVTRYFLTFVNVVLTGLVKLRDAGGNLEEQYDALSTVFKDGGRSALNVLYGVNDAIAMMGTMFDWAITKVHNLSKYIDETFGGDSIRNITKYSLVFGTLAGLASPLLLAMRGLAYVLNSSVVPILRGVVIIAGTLMSAVTLPMMALAGAAALAFAVIRRDGESVGDTLDRVFWTVTATAMQIWDQALLPMYQGIMTVLIPGIEIIAPIFDKVVENITDGILLFTSAFLQANSDISTDWSKTGANIGEDLFLMAATAAEVAETISKVFKFSAGTIGTVFGGVFHVLVQTFSEAAIKFKNIWEGLFQIFSGDGIVAGIIKVGQTINEMMLLPLRAVGRAMVGAMELAGQGDMVPSWVREDLAPRDFRKGDAGPKAVVGPPPLPVPDNPKNYLGQFNQTPANDQVSIENQTNKNAPSPFLFNSNAVADQAAKPPPVLSPFVNDPNKSAWENIQARAAHQKEEMKAKFAPNREQSAAEVQLSALGDVVKKMREEKAKNPQITVKNEVTDKRETTINVNTHLDGKKIAGSTQKIADELAERAGFRNTPWERRIGASHAGWQSKFAGRK